VNDIRSIAESGLPLFDNFGQIPSILQKEKEAVAMRQAEANLRIKQAKREEQAVEAERLRKRAALEAEIGPLS